MSAVSDATPRRRRKPAWVVVAVGAIAALGVLGVWLWRDLASGRAVYVVGDSITALSNSSISAALTTAGYAPRITATPGAKIGQTQDEITSLAGSDPWAWIIELGTDDAGANNELWNGPFLSEWQSVSKASCVIYVTISPRAGPVGGQINAAIDVLAKAHSNVHILDWGQLEYTNPAWVTWDGIHPTPAGQAALASLEAQELQRACPTS
jgi:hypothetical protein